MRHHIGLEGLIVLAFVAPILAYAGVAAWWLIPDRRAEGALPAN